VRDWTGYVVSDIGDPALRDKLARITYYLSDLSKAMGRIQQGQVPDGSGDAIASLTDDGFYFKLKGRPENQDAHGGTGPGGTLTLSSTQATTKGLIYLGDAQDSAYDEVNERLGINQPVPAARLHLKSAGSGVITLVPNSDLVVQWGLNDDSGGAGLATEWQSLVTDDIYGIVRDNGTAGTYICEVGLNGAVTPGTIYTVTLKIKRLFGLVPSGILSVAMTDSAGTLTQSPTTVDCSTLTDAGVNHTFVVNGSTTSGANNNSLRITMVIAASFLTGYTFVGYATITAGVLDATPFQRWESPITSNDLIYAADGAGTTTLQLSGTPPLRLTTAPEFDVGTPVVNHLWTAADTEGTGQWLAASAALSAYASALPTKETFTWEANGPFRAGAEVDGARTVARACTLLTARMYRKTAGAAGSTQVDVLKNGSTTMLAAPITIGAVSGNAVTASAVLIATPTLAAGDWLSCSAVAVETGLPLDWAVVVERY